jgi:hypothetical protein
MPTVSWFSNLLKPLRLVGFSDATQRCLSGLLLLTVLTLSGNGLAEAKISTKNRYGITPPPPVVVPVESTPQTTTTTGNGAVSAPSQSAPAMAPQALSLMERQWLGTTYPNDPLVNRVERLEILLYGQTNPQLALDLRLKALARTYAKAHPAPPKPSATTATNTAPSAKTTGNTLGTYVVVDQMEQQVFHTTYGKEALETRLARLETRVFGAVARPDTSLYDRTEALKQRVLPTSTASTASTGDDEDDGGDVSTLPSGPSSTTGDSNGSIQGLSPLGPRLAALEQALLKTAYPQDGETVRLSRLEMKVFKQVAPANVTPQQRLERLEAVASAPKSGGPIATTGWNGTIQTVLPFAIMLLLLALP